MPSVCHGHWKLSAEKTGATACKLEPQINIGGTDLGPGVAWLWNRALVCTWGTSREPEEDSLESREDWGELTGRGIWGI